MEEYAEEFHEAFKMGYEMGFKNGFMKGQAEYSKQDLSIYAEMLKSLCSSNPILNNSSIVNNTQEATDGN